MTKRDKRALKDAFKAVSLIFSVIFIILFFVSQQMFFACIVFAIFIIFGLLFAIFRL